MSARIKDAAARLGALWRGGLPAELARTRTRFTLLASVIALAGLALALTASYNAMVERAWWADRDALQSYDGEVSVPAQAPELRIPARADIDERDVRPALTQLDSFAAAGDPSSFRSTFHLLAQRDGTALLLSDASRQAEAEEFLAAFGQEGLADTWHGSGGGGAINASRFWSYAQIPMTGEGARTLLSGGSVPYGELARDVPDASDPSVTAALYTVLDATPTYAFSLSTARSMGVIWLVAVVPVLLVCHLLARLALRPAARAWERERTFVADASHELSTPLAALALDVDALAAQPEETVGSQSRWVGYMRRELEEMEGIVFALLADAQADAPREDDRSGSCDAREEAAAAVERARGRHGARAIAFESEVEGVRVGSSAQVLGEALDELLENAMRFSGESDRVGVRVRAVGRREVAIAVSNTGPGIAEDDLPCVFDRFYQADAARTRGGEHRSGFGLGLSIARKRIRACGGDIRAASTPSEQTTFTVTVPTV